ncbi:hypothetical protein ABIA35_006234 [Catenulispora sp. MAP12-49]
MTSFVIMLAAVFTTSAAAKDAGNTTPTPSQHKYQDYLTGSVTATAASSDQCAKPIAQRVGGWSCPTSAPRLKPATGWCDAAGCYYENSQYDVQFDSDSSNWGYGSTTLGTMSGVFEWTLNGTLMTCKPFTYSNSEDTNTVTMSGQLMNPPPGQVGSVIGGTYEQHSFPGLVFSAAWPPPGYQASDNQNFNRTSVQEEAWSLAGYPGYWYFFVKSPIATTAWSTKPYGGFHFLGIDASREPAQSHGGGWHD